MSEIWALGGALLFLALAMFTVWFSIRLVKIESPVVLVALVVTPFFIYAAFSGMLGEIRAPGGLEAKFNSAAQQPVRLTTQSVEKALTPVQITARGALGELDAKLRELRIGEPVILTVQLGKSYTREDWLAYVDALLTRSPLAFAVLVDEEQKFIAYMSTATVKRILGNYALGGELIRLIAEGQTDQITAFPEVKTVVVSTDDSAIKALRLMKQHEVQSLIAIDAEQQIAGVLRMEDVVSQIILDLATDTGS
jgi:CBS domain containing-hemolysin-like protein